MAQGGQIPSPQSPYIYQQIEGSADYNEPAVYELLTFYSALTLQPDELDGQFLPQTDVQKTNNTQTLFMAFGILPPSSNVTGNLIDRSASVTQAMEANAPEVNQPQGTVSGPNGAGATQLSANGVKFIADHEGFGGNPPGTLYYATSAEMAQGMQTIGYGHLLTPAEQASGIYANGITEAQAQTLLASDTKTAQAAVNNNITAPVTQNQYDALVSYAFSTGYAGFSKYGQGIIQAVNQQDYTQAAAVWPSTSTTGVNGQVVPNLVSVRANETNLFTTPDGTSYNFSYKVTTPTTPQGGGPIKGDGSQPTNNWQNSGSANASSALQNVAGTQDSNINQTNLGMQYLAAQQGMINDTLAAIQRMQQTPPLKMLVNPQSFKLSANKIVADSEWGRNGPIIEHWGEQQDKLEISGKVAAFYSLDMTGNGSGSGAGASPGITRIARQYSTAYQNFLSLWLLYKNNGGIYLTDFIESKTSRRTNLSVVGSIYVYYDGIIYIGSFDSLNLTESETAPYTLDYNFTFTVRATFILDNIDNQQLTYGAPPQLDTGQAPTNNVATNPPPTNTAQSTSPPSSGGVTQAEVLQIVP